MTTLSAAVCGTLCTWFLTNHLGMNGAAIGYALTQGLLALFTTIMAVLTFDLPWHQPKLALKHWLFQLPCGFGIFRPACKNTLL